MISRVSQQVRAAGVWLRQRMPRNRRVRRLLALVVALIIVSGIVRLWTWWPDAVQITVMQTRNNGGQPVVVYDRTIHDAAFAQRLQREADGFGVMANPLASTSCAIGFSSYTLTWSRFGIPTEQISDVENTKTGDGCQNIWHEDGFIPRGPGDPLRAFYADMHNAAGVPLPAYQPASATTTP